MGLNIRITIYVHTIDPREIVLKFIKKRKNEKFYGDLLIMTKTSGNKYISISIFP